MYNKNVKSLVLYALFTSLVCVMTMVVQIPVPITNGYVHLGDSVILIVAIFFGRRYGAIAGGVGSMMADILSGYAHWALPTLIIKFAMGYIAGQVSNYRDDKSKFVSMNTISSCLLTVTVMVIGYFIASTIIEGTMAAAATSIFPNIMQGTIGTLLFFVIGKSLDRINIKQYKKKYKM